MCCSWCLAGIADAVADELLDDGDIEGGAVCELGRVSGSKEFSVRPSKMPKTMPRLVHAPKSSVPVEVVAAALVEATGSAAHSPTAGAAAAVLVALVAAVELDAVAAAAAPDEPLATAAVIWSAATSGTRRF